MYNFKNVVLAIGIMTPILSNAQELENKPFVLKVANFTFTKALNGAEKLTAVSKDKLVFNSPGKSDNFRNPNGEVTSNAPLLLTEIDNTKPFTFTGKVTPNLLQTYDAGAFFVWVSDHLWLKLAVERDERKKTRIVTVRTTGTSDDNNHDVVPQPGAYLKISSDVKSIGFYYSLDQKSWQLVRLFKNDYPAKLWVGISAQSPTGNGNSVVFEGLSFVPTAITDFRLGN